MENSGIKRIAILTGGGDCPGLNPAIRGCVYKANEYGWECMGIREGWNGLIESITQPLDISLVKDIVNRGGTILSTSRTNPFKKETGVERCLENISHLKLDALVAMGGEDTLGVAQRLHQEKGVRVVGVPKTMDNDLSATDYTFGFDSSASVAVEAAERLRDTGRSHQRIMVLEVMGRHAGWVALFTGLASGADWILLPEEKVKVETMTEYLKAVYQRERSGLVVVSEGAEIPGVIAETGGKDEFGHTILRKRGIGEQVAALIEEKLSIETRSAVIGHIQRGGSPTLFDRILGLRVGVKAAELIAQGEFGKMVALRGDKVIGVPLIEATTRIKTVPAEWLAFARVFQRSHNGKY